MKRINKVLSIILAAVMTFGILPFAEITVAKAADDTVYTAGIYSYKIINNEYASVVNIIGKATEPLVIPQYLGGYPVKALYDSFGKSVSREYVKNIKTIVLPEGLTSIGNWAFHYASFFDTMVLPKSLTYVGYGCTYGISLQHIYYAGNSSDKSKIHFDYHGLTGSALWDGTWTYNYNIGQYYGYDEITNSKSYSRIEQDNVVSYGSLEQIDNATIIKSGETTKIEASGYYTAEFGDDLTASPIMTYAVVPESTGSHISAVHCNGVDALVDTQYVEFPIAEDSEEDKNRDVIIQVYSDLSNHNGFQLLYDGTVLATSADGLFNLKAKDITTGNTLKVRVIDSDGKTLAKIDTNIKTYRATTTGKFADNKISITFPQDLKIIGGWNFDLDLSSLPFFVIKDEDTIKIGVGASESSKYAKLTSNINDGEDTTSYWDKDGTERSLWFDWKQAVKKTKQDIISNTATTIISEKATDFSSFGCSFVGGELSPVKVDAKAAFYLELKYENGKWAEVGADGFISISASMSWSTFMLVFYVPVEFKVTGKIGASADVSVLYDVNNAKWDYSGTLDITLPSLTGSATIGIPKVFNGGGYVNLTNELKITLWNNIKGTLSGDLGVQGQFVIFSGSKSLWQFLDWEYLNRDFGSSSKKSVKKKSLELPDIGSTDDVFNESAYILDSRDYLENQSEWLASGTSDRSIKKAPSLTKTSTPILLQSSIYQEANPQIISTGDGTTVMVWTADIADRTTGNQTAVVYSVCDDASGNWSAPAIISDDGTADAYPDVATDGENIYVVWVNTNTTFDENVTMEEFAAACEISAAEFDKETGEFGNIQTITNNDRFDFMPAVFADHGEVYVAYTENSDNSPLTMTGSNTVNVMRLAGDTIETVSQTVLDKPVESLDVSTISGALTAAVTVDEDGDLQTTEDVEIYLIDNTGALTQYTDNEMYERSARFESINGEYALAYYDDSGIHYTYDLENETVISLEDGMKVSADYVFVNDGEGAVLLVRANAEDSGKANLYAGVWDGEAWVGDAQITDCSDDLKSFSACKNADGGIKLVYTTAQYETEITEDNGDGSATGTFTETVDMYATAYERTTDVELIAADFDNNSVAQGEVLPVTLYVKNNGLTTVDGINITSACMGVEQSETVSGVLKPGQTDTVRYQLIVPKPLSGVTDVRFTATTDADANPGNNEQTTQIGYTDLSLRIEKFSSRGLTSAALIIANKSSIPSNAKIRLHKGSYDGKSVVEFTVPTISALGEKAFYLSPEIINGNFNYGDAVCVEIVASKDEYLTGDNCDFFTVDTPENEEGFQINTVQVCPDADGDNVYDDVELLNNLDPNNPKTDGITSDYIRLYGQPDISISEKAPVLKNGQVTCTLTNKTSGKAMRTFINLYVDDLLTDQWSVNINSNSVLTFSFPEEYLSQATDSVRIEVDENHITNDTDYTNNTYVYYSVKTLSLVNESITMVKGQSLTLTTDCSPDSLASMLKWSVSGNSKITVNNGTVTANGIGKATITVASPSGLSDTCDITVVAFDGAEYSDFDSVLINNGTEVAITGYIGNDTNIEIPEMIGGLPVTTINASAFDNMSIESVHIPAGITKIADSAFKRLANLREFIVAEENDQYISYEGVLFSKDHSTLVKYPAAKVGAEYAIGESTQTVCGYAFYGTALENITIGNSVRTIGNSAFENSDSFSTIVVPENVSTIGSLAFANCDGLQEVIYNATSASTSGNIFTVLLGNSTVFANSPVIKLSIGNNVKQIPGYIFARMNQLKSVDFSGNNMLSSIGSYSFYMNSKIESIILPNSVTAINSYAFYGCSSVNTVLLSNSLNTIGNYAFNNCSSVYSIDLPDTVTDVGTYAFSGCSSLESVAIPAKVRIIKANTFNNCVNLASVKFKSGNEYEIYKLEAENVHIVSGNPNWSNSSASGGHAVDYANNIDFDINVTTAGSFLITEFAFCHDRNFKLYVDNTLYGTYTGPGYDLRKNAFVTLALSEGKHNICFKNNSGYPPIYDYFYIEPLGNATAEVQGSEVLKFDCVNSVDANAFNGCSNLTDVYYPGTVSQWKQTMIASGNAPLNSATLHTEAKLVNSTTWKGHSYQLYLNTVTWKEAKGISESLNGHLVTITSAEEQAVIENLIGQFKEDNCIWLGAENESSGSYSWVTGEEWGYSNWEDGEPGGGEEHYLATCYGTEWNDFRNNSSTLTGFIVEFEPSCYSGETVNHTWDDGVITKKVTCTEEGIITYTCVVCEETNTETIIALDHNYGAWTKIDDNQHQRICENDSSHVEKENHSWDNGTVTKAATCTEAGIRTFTCTVCGAKRTESIKATGHNYSAWTIVKAPTCTAEGVEQRVCSNNNKHVETRPIAKSAHVDNDGDGYCDNCHTNLGSGGETHESNCVCGKNHTGPFAGLIKFFHRIVYFFKNLFGKN